MKVFPISRLLPVAEVPDRGRHVELEADAAERAALAELFRVPAVTALAARLDVTPWRGDGVRVRGRVTGAVEQTCVVTLDPVVQPIDEAIDVRLEPEAPARGGRRGGDAVDREVVVDPVGEDPPETFAGGRVDLGAIAAEHFALGIDPYPRAPGAVFEDVIEDADDGDAGPEAPESPFAVLKRLDRGG